MQKVLIFLFFIHSVSVFSQVSIISDFNPKKGDVGTLVFIKGKYFKNTLAGNTIYLGAVKAKNQSVSGDSLIVVSVPNGATNQRISVTTSDGLTGLSNSSFNVTFPNNNYLDEQSFSTIKTFPTSINDYNPGIAAGDLDLDGKPDVVTAGNGIVQVFRNTTTSTDNITFASPVQLVNTGKGQKIILADMDGDGKLDIATDKEVYRNLSTTGAISFTSGTIVGNGTEFIISDHPNTSIAYYTASITYQDYQLPDGKPDYVYVNGSNINIRFNSSTVGNMKFDAVNSYDFYPGQASRMEASHFINDVDQLLFKSSTGFSINYYYGNYQKLRGITNIALNSVAVTSASGYQLFSKDFDGDQTYDLAILNAYYTGSTGKASVEYFKVQTPITSSLSNLIFSSGLIYDLGDTESLSDGSRYIAPTNYSDITGDGLVDMVTITNGLTIYANQSYPGFISFANPVKASSSTISGVNPFVIDINQDNKPDILLTDFNSFSIAVNKTQFVDKSGFITGYSKVCPNQQNVTYTAPLVLGATSYEWELPANVTVVGSNTGQNITLNFPASLPVTGSTLRVRGSNGNVKGDFSAFFVIYTSDPIIAPANITTLVKGSQEIDVQWDANTAKNIIFKVERSEGDDQNFVQILRLSSQNADNIYKDESVRAGTTYYYRVKTALSDNQDCGSDYSPIVGGSTPESPITAIESDNLENFVSVYPNPTDGEFNLNFKKEIIGKTEVKVMDVFGRIVQAFTNETAKSQIIRLKNNNSGIYFIQVETKKGKVIKRVIKF